MDRIVIFGICPFHDKKVDENITEQYFSVIMNFESVCEGNEKTHITLERK